MNNHIAYGCGEYLCRVTERLTKVFRRRCLASGAVLLLSCTWASYASAQDGGASNGNGATNPLAIEVTSTPGAFQSAGDSISYQYEVTNVSTTDIANVIVNDELAGGSVCQIGLLSPSITATCTAIYFVTDEDVAAGVVTNTATVVGDGVPGTAGEQTTVVLNNGGLSIVVDTAPDSFSAAGQVITYDYTVTNNSTNALTGIAVTDPLVGGVVCSDVGLSPSFAVTCTQVYTITEEDVIAGEVTSTITAVADQAASAQAMFTLATGDEQNPEALFSPITQARFSCASDTTDFDYRIINSSFTSPLTNLVVTDERIGEVCRIGLLSPTQEVQCLGVYFLTAEDKSIGRFTSISMLTADQFSEPLLTRQEGVLVERGPFGSILDTCDSVE